MGAIDRKAAKSLGSSIQNEGPLPKIVAIGFNKCATRSFARLFKKAGHPVVHQKLSRFVRPFGPRKLGTIMQANQRAGLPVFSGIDNYLFYGDLICSTPEGSFDGNSLFREIIRDYPNAILILNLRSCDDWVRSRLQHGHGEFAARELRARGCVDLVELSGRWREDWDSHLREVRSFMRKYPDQLIEYNLDSDCIDDFVARLSAYGLSSSDFIDIGRSRGMRRPPWKQALKRWFSHRRPRTYH